MIVTLFVLSIMYKPQSKLLNIISCKWSYDIDSVGYSSYLCSCTGASIYTVRGCDILYELSWV